MLPPSGGAKVHPDDQSAFLASNQEILDGRANIHYVEYRAQNKEGKWDLGALPRTDAI